MDKGFVQKDDELLTCATQQAKGSKKAWKYFLKGNDKYAGISSSTVDGLVHATTTTTKGEATAQSMPPKQP